MVTLTLPDGTKRAYDGPVTGLQVATDIGPGLAKAALAVKINGELSDLNLAIEQDCAFAIVTSKDEDALALLRHDAAHIMAEAVKELYPNVQVTIGPAIDNGFYYDFARAEPFVPEDLEKIEKRMAEIVDRDEAITREVWSRADAIQFFKDAGEHYKAQIIESIPEDQDIRLYRQGNFIDLCRGPHLPSTGKLGKAFKLMKLAGAYWRGDSNNEMLQRIYGTAWADKKQLDAYLLMLEEAEKRDHRRLAREMDLFHFQEEAPGAVFWHPKGWRLFQTLINYMRKRQEDADYVEISTPSVMDRHLWELSGHWENFRENMYTTQTEDDRVFALKPMNCPGGIQVYKQGITSYKDLPRRIAEFGKVNRYEPSGSLHGIMRVREFTQDDAHIFCTTAQLQGECETVVKMIMEIYKDFGFEDVRIKFSDRPEKRLGSNAIWDTLESALKGALDQMGYPYSYNPGEGAFYGPKLEFVLRDAIGRDWQCGTLQVDMNLPERLDVHYIDEVGDKVRPVMLHRALFGSLERFTGILIEHFAGRLPLWLAPVQVVVATITSDADAYAAEVFAALKSAGIRAEIDIRNEKINYKVREHSHVKVPIMLVVGKREADEGKVAMRRLGGKDQEILALKEAIDILCDEARGPLSGS
ncbi:MAG: threonine--tRNA ligase [Rhodospirillales bacterium]|nr:threonine--tRNA ligase [Rhodospirillales bacterium]